MRVPYAMMDRAHIRMKEGPSAYHQASIFRKRSTPMNGVTRPVAKVTAPKKLRTFGRREEYFFEKHIRFF